MKFYVTGYAGRIGRRLLNKGCLPLVCDVSDYESVTNMVWRASADGADAIIHLASVSDVDVCESDRERALNVNFKGTRFLAEACHANKIPMVFLSTDHIFDGKKGPYKEDYAYYSRNLLGKYQSPVNYYGLTKLTAELVANAYPFKIVRTSYIFDISRMRNVVREADYPTFMNRSFMYIEHLVESLKSYLDRIYEMPKVLNISGSQTVSWYEFMLAEASVFGKDKSRIIPRTKERKRPITDSDTYDYAPRPRKAGLVTTLSAKIGIPQFSYIDGLKQMKEDMEKEIE